jgi:hypothetical protein
MNMEKGPGDEVPRPRKAEPMKLSRAQPLGIVMKKPTLYSFTPPLQGRVIINGEGGFILWESHLIPFFSIEKTEQTCYNRRLGMESNVIYIPNS